MITIAREDPRGPDIAPLLAASDALMADLYPAEANVMLDAETLVRSDVWFFVARLEGAAVGCGAWVRRTATQAELKRLFVMPGARGRGLGRSLLQHIEQDAFARDIRLILLETGIRQPAALALYRRCGYAQRGPFAPYDANPWSLFMERPLG